MRVKGGFSFCGVDIGTIGLQYAPELKNTYIYKDTNYSVSEQKFEGHDGGYFYGMTAVPKDFVLRCYYEDDHVLNGIISKINYYFKKGKTGKLIFAKRPWCWYNATVIDVNIDNMLNYRNGLVTIQMRAYYPFARTNITSITSYDPPFKVKKDMFLNSGIFMTDAENPTTEMVSSTPITNTLNCILYNAGTERAKVAIEIAGNVGSGVTITNKTTGQTCKFVAITDNVTTSQNKYIVADGLNGKTILTNAANNNPQLAFLYHDEGFIDLEPAFPIIRNLDITCASNSNIVTMDRFLTEDVVGKYIYINATWIPVVAQSYTGTPTLTLQSAAGITGTYKTNIVKMNDIEIKAASTMSLTRLNFKYLPTFS